MIVLYLTGDHRILTRLVLAGLGYRWDLCLGDFGYVVGKAFVAREMIYVLSFISCEIMILDFFVMHWVVVSLGRMPLLWEARVINIIGHQQMIAGLKKRH